MISNHIPTWRPSNLEWFGWLLHLLVPTYASLEVELKTSNAQWSFESQGSQKLFILIFFTAAVAIALLGKIPEIRTCALSGW
jgi:hypothetical protein